MTTGNNNLNLQMTISVINNAAPQLQNLQQQLVGLQGAINNLANNVTAGAGRAAAGLHGVGAASTGVTRELIVLGHEAMTGQFSRFGGSLVVLGERMGGLVSWMSQLGIVGGGALAAMIVPMAAIGYQVYHILDGVKQLNNALALTHNYSGLTPNNLTSFVNANASIQGYNNASRALLALARTGQFTTSEINVLGTAILQMSKLSGESADKLAEKFAKLGEAPTKFANELNQTMHFLTPAQQALITNLEATGQKSEATHVLMTALSKEMAHQSDVALKHIGILGHMKSAYDAVAEGINHVAEGWAYAFTGENDLIKPTTRIKILTKEIAEAQKDLTRPLSIWENAATTRYDAQVKLNKLIAERTQLFKEEAARQKETNEAWVSKEYQERATAVRGYLSAAKDVLLMEQELAKVRRDFAQGRQVAPNDPIFTAEREAKALQAVRDKYRNAPDDQRQRQLYEAQIAELDGNIKREQLLLTEATAFKKVDLAKGLINQQEYDAAIEQLRVAALKKEEEYVRKKIVAAQALAAATGGREGVRQVEQYKQQLAEMNAAEKVAHAESEAEAAKHARTIENIGKSLTTELTKISDKRSQEQSAAINKIALSAKEAALEDELQKTRDTYEQIARAKEDEMRRLNASEAQIAAVRKQATDAEAAALEQTKKNYAARTAAEENWKNGAQKALKDYLDSAQNASKIMAGFVTNMSSQFSNAIYNFLQTGKLSFKTLTNDFKSAIDRMLADALAARLMQSLFGGFASSGNTASGGGAILGGIASMLGFRADGGPVEAGMPYIVGEKRPELFIPRTSGTIVPSISSLSATTPSHNVVNLNIQAMDSKDVINKLDEIKRPLAQMLNGVNKTYRMS